MINSIIYSKIIFWIVIAYFLGASNQSNFSFLSLVRTWFGVSFLNLLNLQDCLQQFDWSLFGITAIEIGKENVQHEAMDSFPLLTYLSLPMSCLLTEPICFNYYLLWKKWWRELFTLCFLSPLSYHQNHNYNNQNCWIRLLIPATPIPIANPSINDSFESVEDEEEDA
jgi:hypothetical protein